MGTHPIFESDFDCLTVIQTEWNQKKHHSRMMTSHLKGSSSKSQSLSQCARIQSKVRSIESKDRNQAQTRTVPTIQTTVAKKRRKRMTKTKSSSTLARPSILSRMPIQTQTMSPSELCAIRRRHHQLEVCRQAEVIAPRLTNQQISVMSDSHIRLPFSRQKPNLLDYSARQKSACHDIKRR